MVFLRFDLQPKSAVEPARTERVQEGMQGSYDADDMLLSQSAGIRPEELRNSPTRLIRKKTRRARQASPETSRPAPARRPTLPAPVNR